MRVEIKVREVYLEKMDYQGHVVLKGRKVELVTLGHQDFKEIQESQAVKGRWDLQVSREPQDWLDNLDNRDLLGFLGIQAPLDVKEILDHQEQMAEME